MPLQIISSYYILHKKTPTSGEAREKSTVFGDLIKREFYLSLLACCDLIPEGTLVHSPGCGPEACIVVADEPEQLLTAVVVVPVQPEAAELLVEV